MESDVYGFFAPTPPTPSPVPVAIYKRPPTSFEDSQIDLTDISRLIYHKALSLSTASPMPAKSELELDQHFFSPTLNLSILFLVFFLSVIVH